MEKELKTILESVKSEVLTDDVKKEVAVLFEATVKQKVDAEKAKLDEAYKSKMTQLDEKFVEYKSKKLGELDVKAAEYVDKVLFEAFDKYTTHCAEEYLKENHLAIEQGVQASMFEKLAKGVRQVLSENSIPEAQAKGAEDLGKTNVSLKESLDQAHKDMIALKEELKGIKVQKAFDEVTGELTAAQKKELGKLCEDFAVSDLKAFQEKVKISKKLVLKEQAVAPVTTAPAPKVEPTPDLSGSTLITEDVQADLSAGDLEQAAESKKRIDDLMNSKLMEESMRLI